jgi:quercetin dioxygenase-like cupin family protein
MPVRRVATGTSTQGRSVVALDEMIEPVTVAALPGYAWHRLWSFDKPPEHPGEVRAAAELAHFPPAGGVRFTVFTVPPATTARAPLTQERRRELDQKLPGRSAVMESDQDGMHRTPTVDLIVVLSGRVSLHLDDGAVVDLNTGDCLVQNGTRHAWRNDTDEPCTLGVVLIGVASSS